MKLPGAGIARRALSIPGRMRSALGRRAARVTTKWRRITVAVLVVLVLATGTAATLLALAARDAAELDAARFDAVTQARQRVAQLLTYSATTIDTDIDRARQDTAGAFAEYYAPFAQRTIEPAVKSEGTTSIAAVTRAAAISVTTDTVVVVVFIDQQTSSKAQPQARSTSSTARVTMTKVAGQWLISALTPTSASQ